MRLVKYKGICNAEWINSNYQKVYEVLNLVLQTEVLPNRSRRNVNSRFPTDSSK
jgi:hypothetical protein